MLVVENEQRSLTPASGRKRALSELSEQTSAHGAGEAPDDLLLFALHSAETDLSPPAVTVSKSSSDMKAGFVASVARGTLDGFVKARATSGAAAAQVLPVPRPAGYALAATATALEPSLPSCWRQALAAHFQSKSWESLNEFLQKEIAQGKRIFPPQNLVFHAFQRCPLEKVKVVIIGQDPYHNVGQAHGLCFSVPRGVVPPPSLLNIYGELAREFPESDPEPFRPPNHGCLEAWADQGVLLLNAVLTVEAHKPGSHAKHGGWQKFTDEVIRVLDQQKLAGTRGLVFMLWGNFAKEKCSRVNANRHLVLQAAHPSPMAAARGGWFGCNHFRKANEYLQSLGLEPIRWHAIADR
jgi:uracil-DNA glycosylase